MKKEKSNTQKDILKFKVINRLKSVYRLNSADNRKESTAEHSWSTLILSDYFLNKIIKTNPSLKLDRLKIYELLMYHDLVEIHTGDFQLFPGGLRNKQDEQELLAAQKIKKELPLNLSEKFYSLFIEFKEQKTLESKFARAIDSLDAPIQEIDYKVDWKGWTKQFLIDKKLKYFEEFPEIKKEFLELLDYFEDEGYFSQ